MLLQKDSSAHKCVGVDVGLVTLGFWFAVKVVVVFQRITTFFLFLFSIFQLK